MPSQSLGRRSPPPHLRRSCATDGLSRAGSCEGHWPILWASSQARSSGRSSSYRNFPSACVGKISFSSVATRNSQAVWLASRQRHPSTAAKSGWPQRQRAGAGLPLSTVLPCAVNLCCAVLCFPCPLPPVLCPYCTTIESLGRQRDVVARTRGSTGSPTAHSFTTKSGVSDVRCLEPLLSSAAIMT